MICQEKHQDMQGFETFLSWNSYQETVVWTSNEISDVQENKVKLHKQFIIFWWSIFHSILLQVPALIESVSLEYQKAQVEFGKKKNFLNSWIYFFSQRLTRVMIWGRRTESWTNHSFSYWSRSWMEKSGGIYPPWITHQASPWEK